MEWNQDEASVILRISCCWTWNQDDNLSLNILRGWMASILSTDDGPLGRVSSEKTSDQGGIIRIRAYLYVNTNDNLNANNQSIIILIICIYYHVYYSQ